LGNTVLQQGTAQPPPAQPLFSGEAILKLQSDITVRSEGDVSPRAAETIADIVGRKLQDALQQQLGGGGR